MKEISLILPSSSDPLITDLWLLNLETYKSLFTDFTISFDFLGEYFDDEIDILKVYYNELASDKNFHCSFNSHSYEHGLNLRNILTDNYNTLQDHIFFAEEDDLILNPHLLTHEIETYFKNDISVLGVARGSCTQELNKKIEEYITNQTDVSIIKDEDNSRHEFNFWPCLFLIPKRILQKYLNEEKIFCSKSWDKNEPVYIGNKKYTFNDSQCGDTFVNFSMKLFGDRDIKSIRYVSKTYHSLIEDHLYCIPKYIKEYNTRSILDDSIDFHIGSLSCIMRFKMWKPIVGNEVNMRVRIDEFMRFINNDVTDETVKYQMCIEFYRRFYILHKFFKLYINPSKFKYYKNYNDSFNLLFYWFINDYKLPDKFSKFNCIYNIPNEANEAYTNIANKLFKPV